MRNEDIKHSCGHIERHNICEHGTNRIIRRASLMICSQCRINKLRAAGIDINKLLKVK